MSAFVLIEEKGQVKGIVFIKKDPNPPYKLRVEVKPLSALKFKVFNREGERLPLKDNIAVLPITVSLKEDITTVQPFTPKRKVIPEGKGKFDTVTLISTWNEKCGIATYSRFLREALLPEIPVHVCRYIWDVKPPTLIHTQLEFGIFPKKEMVLSGSLALKACGKVATWHTVFKNPGSLRDYIEAVDREYDAHIVHNALAKKWLMQVCSKPIHIIPHGSVLWKNTSKKEARLKLGIPLDAQVLFAFGFSADTKGFPEIAQAVSRLRRKHPRLTLIITGAVHGIAKEESGEALARIQAYKTEGIHILGRYLTEEEVNLYADASDILAFNYVGTREVASASGAIHRVINAGKPLIVSDDPRTIEFYDGIHCLKYPMGDTESLGACIETLLEEPDMAEEIGRNVKLYAEATSWKRVARQHMQVYSSIAKGTEVFSAEYYDEEYYAGKRGGLSYITPNGKIRRWSYYNPQGEWLGAKPIMEAIKELFNPKNMLDVGCGRGTFTAYAKDVGIDAVGIDFSRWAVEHPYPRAKGLIQLGDVRDIKFPDNSFDLVFATDIMEHIYEEDLEKVISEFQRVARHWIFYNIGSTMHEDDEYFVLKKGEIPPIRWQSTAVAGHVNVRPCIGYWKKKLVNKEWILRDDLVERFRQLVPKEVLANWICIIITEKKDAHSAK